MLCSRMMRILVRIIYILFWWKYFCRATFCSLARSIPRSYADHRAHKVRARTHDIVRQPITEQAEAGGPDPRCALKAHAPHVGLKAQMGGGCVCGSRRLIAPLMRDIAKAAQMSAARMRRPHMVGEERRHEMEE